MRLEIPLLPCLRASRNAPTKAVSCRTSSSSFGSRALDLPAANFALSPPGRFPEPLSESSNQLWKLPEDVRQLPRAVSNFPATFLSSGGPRELPRDEKVLPARVGNVTADFLTSRRRLEASARAWEASTGLRILPRAPWMLRKVPWIFPKASRKSPKARGHFKKPRGTFQTSPGS
jgi:hypothetical protein